MQPRWCHFDHRFLERNYCIEIIRKPKQSEKEKDICLKFNLYVDNTYSVKHYDVWYGCFNPRFLKEKIAYAFYMSVFLVFLYSYRPLYPLFFLLKKERQIQTALQVDRTGSHLKHDHRRGGRWSLDRDAQTDRWTDRRADNMNRQTDGLTTGTDRREDRSIGRATTVSYWIPFESLFFVSSLTEERWMEGVIIICKRNDILDYHYTSKHFISFSARYLPFTMMSCVSSELLAVFFLPIKWRPLFFHFRNCAWQVVIEEVKFRFVCIFGYLLMTQCPAASY